ncbi:LegC family aminotransferase [Achromobacter animicus]|uniref:LegC family aminotransferase n=1 Tax=Achromobacter animicus TaxID=1389935 RepID=UPI0028A61FEE|nr:LegC family aminotransferase [Achromobacter animicus]
MEKIIVDFVRSHYGSNEFIPLHAPAFVGKERDYVDDTIRSTFVSSVGAYVDRFERDIERFTGSERAVATVNGTSALHVALRLCGVQQGDLVITQPLTFVATCNAIKYAGADPLFVDVDRDTMGLSPAAVQAWLSENATLDAGGNCVCKATGRRISACMPMHTFGHPVRLEELQEVCKRWNLALIEDAAESLGSYYRGRHTGTFGQVGTLSFNGNKVITTGGGGMILASEEIGARAKHMTTTAKVPHQYEYVHDELGFNYRLPNLNAALGCAQVEMLPAFLEEKRQLAHAYESLLEGSGLQFFKEAEFARSNYWLNAIICEDKHQRDHVLASTNGAGVMTRPIWQLMNRLPMYANCPKGPLDSAEWLVDRVVNLPSSVKAAVKND